MPIPVSSLGHRYFDKLLSTRYENQGSYAWKKESPYLGSGRGKSKAIPVLPGAVGPDVLIYAGTVQEGFSRMKSPMAAEFKPLP